MHNIDTALIRTITYYYKVNDYQFFYNPLRFAADKKMKILETSGKVQRKARPA